MTATDEQLVEGAVEARERSVGTGPPRVDEVVDGGRRRLRHRRVAAALPAVALALAAGGAALAVFGGGGEGQPAPPASSDWTSRSSGPTSFDGCSAQPATCDAGAVAQWVSERVDGLAVAGGEAFEPASSASALDGFPEGTVYFTTADMQDSTDMDQPIDEIVFPPEVEIYVAAKGSDNRFWSAEPTDAEGRAAEREVTIRPGLRARVIDGEGSTTLTVPEGEGHGAVYLTMQDQSGRGGESLTEGDLVDLVRFLLEDPESTGR